MRNVMISKSGPTRYTIHSGSTKIEGEADVIGRLLLERLEETMRETPDEVVVFEFVGSLPERELATVVHELDCVRKSKEALQLAYECKVPTRELREAYDCWVTAAYTQSLSKLYRALGLQPEFELERKAS